MTPRSLRDLDARLIRLEVRVETRRRVRPEIWETKKADGLWVESDFYDWEGPCEFIIDVDTVAEADGLRLLCPKCYDDPPVGPVGTHSVICWSPKIGQDHLPGPGRWDLVGTSLDDLTLIAGSSSVLLQGGCGAHFFVRQGHVVPC
jgi:hypothetical protein